MIANHFILSVYGEDAKLNGPRDRRFGVEHVQHVSQGAIGNFAKQGVVASMHPYHLYDDGIGAYTAGNALKTEFTPQEHKLPKAGKLSGTGPVQTLQE